MRNIKPARKNDIVTGEPRNTREQFMTWSEDFDQTIHVRAIFIDAANDLNAGIILSQLIHCILQEPPVRGNKASPAIGPTTKAGARSSAARPFRAGM